MLFSSTIRLIGLLLLANCAREATVLSCSDVRGVTGDPWVFRLHPSTGNVEMVVHVPEDSIKSGVPPGNRKGTLHTTDRVYEIVIPADSGGRGNEVWGRMQFSLQLDRFTGQGMVEIGEKRYGETVRIPVRCTGADKKPLL